MDSSKLLGRLNSIFYVLSLAIAAWVSVVTVTELVARQTLSQHISNKINELSSTFVESIRISTVQEPENLLRMNEFLRDYSAQYEYYSSQNFDHLSDEERKQEKARIDELKEAIDELQNRISAVEKLLNEERKNLANQNLNISKELEDKINTITKLEYGKSKIRSLALSGEGTIKEIDDLLFSSFSPADPNFIPKSAAAIIFEFHEGMKSDYLLALAVLSSAIAGSLIFGLRSEEIFAVRQIALGLAAGIVTYFAIKGGKTIILVDGIEGITAFNPYGSAFLGLLSGIFTEKAFSLLKDVVDSTTERVRVAAGINSTPQGNTLTSEGINLTSHNNDEEKQDDKAYIGEDAEEKIDRRED